MLQPCSFSQYAFVGVMVASDVIASVTPQASVAVVVATIHPKPFVISFEQARVRAQLISLMSQRPLEYHGVARWLSSHAARHGQTDPTLGKTWLPAGDVRSYYALYKQDMLQRHGVTQATGQQDIAWKRKVVAPHSASPVDAEAHVSESHGMASGSSADAEAYGPAVDFDSFAKAWHVECPWLVICVDANKADAEAYVSASQGMADDMSADAETYVSASTDSPPANVLKRPAAHRKQQAPVQYIAEAEPAIPPPPPAWSQPAPASQPQWASHAIRVLQERGHLPTRSGQEKHVELTVWSDCSGINSEMFAFRELGKALLELLNARVTWLLYMTCETDKMSCAFAKLNHNPVHVTGDMLARNFQSGQVHCTKHDENHDMPRRGVDVYVGTYPCSPWSRRGKRTGFNHPEAELSIIGFKTIAFIGPAVFVLELGEMPNHSDLNEILEKLQGIVQTGVSKYTIQAVRNLTPAWSGYPTRRKRLFIIGWREDIDGARVGAPLQSLMDAPMIVEQTFLRFLGLQRGVDWSRMGECPSQEELLYLSASPCTCGLDPMVLCPMHPCKCNRCGESGLECTWRNMFLTFIVSGPMADVVSKRKGMVTYLQVLEMHGRLGPQQPRQRVLINLIAIRADTQPLNETLMVGDLSQNPPFGDMFSGGDTPVFTTSSNVWVFQVGDTLRTSHMAALMGLDLSVVKFSERMSETWFRQRLGLAVHIANFGLVLTAALAPPLQACLG